MTMVVNSNLKASVTAQRKVLNKGLNLLATQRVKLVQWMQMPMLGAGQIGKSLTLLHCSD